MKKLSVILFVLYLSYPVSSRTYYVAKNGNDKNSGNNGTPFLTISKGAEMAQPGDTVFVRKGIYRERVSPPRSGSEGKPIVFMAEPNENVIIKGSDIWTPKWNKLSSKVYFAVPNEKLFNDNCYKDSKNPFKVESASTPYGREGKAEVENFGYNGDTTIAYTIGQVFVDGKMYVQCPFLSEMNSTDKSWYYDKKSGNIYIHFDVDNPRKKIVEISTRRRIFAPHKRQLGYITVQGFVMEHCGNQYPANFWEANHSEWQQAGAIGTRSGHHWIIKNNVIRFANGVGIDFGNEGDKKSDIETGQNGMATGSSYHIIDSNIISDNGAAGTAAYSPNNITFTNNVIERNINLRFVGKKRWESGAVKMHAPNNSIIANNLIRDNYGKWGLWLDQGSGKNTRVHGNVIIGSEVGFDLEIGTAEVDKLILDNNIFINNHEAIGSRESGGITALHNLILGATDVGVSNTINTSREGRWTSDFHYYFNNIFLNCKSLITMCSPKFYRSADRKFDYNVYQAKPDEKRFKIIDKTSKIVNFYEWNDSLDTYNTGTYCERNSRLISDINYEVNTTELSLKLDIMPDFFTAKTIPYKVIDIDFNRDVINQDGSALPGPFQKLIVGTNSIKLWMGIKPLTENEYPFK